MKGFTKQQKRVLQYMRHIDSQAEKQVTISPQKIAARTESIQTLEQLQANLDAIDPEFAEFQKLTCRKTGQVVGHNTAYSISRTVQILGRAKAVELLRLQSTQHCAPHWINTSGSNLTQLAKHDPIGYFVYAACKCAKLDGPYNDAQDSRLRMMHAYNLEAQATAAATHDTKTSRDWRDQFQNIADDNEKIKPFRGAARPKVSADDRWKRHIARRRMYESLAAQRVPLETIIEANELMRRVLAMAHPRELPNGKWANTAILACANEQRAREWIEVVRSFLQKTIRAALVRNFNKAKEPMRRYRQVANTYISLRYRHGGLTAFGLQENLHRASGLEAAMLDIDDLDIFDGEKESWRIKLRGQARSDTKAKAKAAEDAQKYSGAAQQSTTVPQVAEKQTAETPSFKLKLPTVPSPIPTGGGFKLKIPR